MDSAAAFRLRPTRTNNFHHPEKLLAEDNEDDP
jgi:hypothetical protein